MQPVWPQYLRPKAHTWAHTSEAIQSVCWMCDKTGAKVKKRRCPHTTTTPFIAFFCNLSFFWSYIWAALTLDILRHPSSPAKWWFLESVLASQWLKVFKSCGDQLERRTQETKLWVNKGTLCLYTLVWAMMTPLCSHSSIQLLLITNYFLLSVLQQSTVCSLQVKLEPKMNWKIKSLVEEIFILT